MHTDIKARDEALLTDSEFAVKVGGITYAERADGGNALIAAVSGAKTGVTTEIGEYKGFSLLVEKNFMGLNYLVLRGKTDYKVELSTSPVGNMVKMENCFNGIQGNVDFLEKKLSEYERDMEQAKLEYEKPFQYEQELTEKLKRQFELNTMLDLENKTIAEDKEENLSHVAEPTNPYPNKKEEGAR